MIVNSSPYMRQGAPVRCALCNAPFIVEDEHIKCWRGKDHRYYCCPTRIKKGLGLASALLLGAFFMWMLDVTSSSASPAAQGYAATRVASHGRTHRTAKRRPGPLNRDGGRGIWNGPPGYGSAPDGSTWRSWIEMQHYLDPCHCPGSGA